MWRKGISVIWVALVINLVSISLALAQTPTREQIMGILADSEKPREDLVALGDSVAPEIVKCLPLAQHPGTLLGVISDLKNRESTRPLMDYVMTLRKDPDAGRDAILLRRCLDTLGEVGDERIEDDLVILMNDPDEKELLITITAAKVIGRIGSPAARKSAADRIQSFIQEYKKKPYSAANLPIRISLTFAAGSLCDDSRLFDRSLKEIRDDGTPWVGPSILPLISENLEKGRLTETQTLQVVSAIANDLRDSVRDDPFLYYELNLARLDTLCTHHDKVPDDIRAVFRKALLEWRALCKQSPYSESQAYKLALSKIQKAIILIDQHSRNQ